MQPNFSDKKLLIFDLDGTLIDSVPDLALAINQMLQTLGRATFEEEVIRQWVGNGAKILVERSLSASHEIDPNLDPSLVEHALDIFLQHYQTHLCDRTQPYPHVQESLKELQSWGYTLTIITNKPAQFVEPILKNLALDRFITHYLGGDSLPHKKPHPLPLQHLCKTLNIPLSLAVMIGDSRNDLIAAQNAPMQSIAVTYGYNQGENLADYYPTAIIDNFADILPLFKR